MSFPRYPKYKASGVEWLGEVPDHWVRTSLKHIANYQNGYPFKPDERGDVGLPILRIAQLTGDERPALFDGELPDRVRVRSGDLLFSWSANIDAFIWQGEGAWLNQHIFKVTPFVGTHRKFLFYIIKHVAPKLADFDAHGSTMRHIKKESLGEPVYAPLLPEQTAIAEFLDRETGKIDELVAEQRRLMELLKEKRQAVISHAVTKGLNPHTPMKPSGIEWLGDVPTHWAVMPVGHRYSVQLGKMLDGSKITGRHLRPYLRVFDVQWEEIKTNDLPSMDFDEAARTKFRLKPGVFLSTKAVAIPDAQQSGQERLPSATTRRHFTG